MKYFILGYASDKSVGDFPQLTTVDKFCPAKIKTRKGEILYNFFLLRFGANQIHEFIDYPKSAFYVYDDDGKEFYLDINSREDFESENKKQYLVFIPILSFPPTKIFPLIYLKLRILVEESI